MMISTQRLCVFAVAILCFCGAVQAQQLFAPLPVGARQQMSTKAVEVEVSLYDLAGKQLKVLLDQDLNAGLHEISLETSDLAQGTHVLSMKTSESRLQKQVVIAD